MEIYMQHTLTHVCTISFFSPPCCFNDKFTPLPLHKRIILDSEYYSISHSSFSPLPSSVSIISPRSTLLFLQSACFSFFTSPSHPPHPQHGQKSLCAKVYYLVFELFLTHISLNWNRSAAGEAYNRTVCVYVCGRLCVCV